jgi:hypothetical protein
MRLFRQAQKANHEDPEDREKKYLRYFRYAAFSIIASINHVIDNVTEGNNSERRKLPIKPRTSEQSKKFTFTISALLPVSSFLPLE